MADDSNTHSGKADLAGQSNSAAPSPAPRSGTSMSLSRLTSPNRSHSRASSTNKSLPPILRLTPSQQERSVQHLYTESISRHQRAIESLEKQHHKPMVVFGNKTVSEDECQYMTKRLFNDSVVHKQQSLERMTQAAVDKQLKQAGCGKRFESPSKEKSSVRRLYDTLERDKTISQKLFEKYNPPRKHVVLPVHELQENDQRFYSGNFGKRE